MVSTHFGGGLNCDVTEVRSVTALGAPEVVKVPDNDSKKKALPTLSKRSCRVIRSYRSSGLFSDSGLYSSRLRGSGAFCESGCRA